MSPDNSQILYAFTESPIAGKGGEVFRSINGGQDWIKIDQSKSFKTISLNNDNPTEVIS